MKNNYKTLVTIISSFYFITALLEIFTYFIFDKILPISSVSIPVFLTVLYLLTSTNRNKLFIIVLFFLLIENVWSYIFDLKDFLSIICSSVQKIAIIVLIIRSIKNINYLYLSIAFFVFLLIFLYLFSTINETSYIDINILLLQNILISIIGSLAVSSYIVDDNRQNSWLLISVMLFIGLKFMLFIQSYYSTDLTLPVIHPIILVLNVFAYFTLYKFVIEAEKKEMD